MNEWAGRKSWACRDDLNRCIAALVVASADASSPPDCSDIGFGGARWREAVDAEPRHSSAVCRSRSPAAHIASLQQPSEEALRSGGIAPGLNQNIEHNAILIDSAPEIVLHAL